MTSKLRITLQRIHSLSYVGLTINFAASLSEQFSTLLLLFFYSWDPNKRMNPEEAFQHDWIKEGMVQRSRVVNRGQQRRGHERSNDADGADKQHQVLK